MADVQQIPFQPTYKKENGVFVIDITSVHLPETFTVKQQSLVVIPPGEVAGNHKHPRQELFIGLSKGLEFIWQSEKGVQHLAMRKGEQLFLIVVPAFIPHAIKNNGTEEGVLFEFADDIQHDVMPLNIL